MQNAIEQSMAFFYAAARVAIQFMKCLTASP